jgi:hypothetical protein
MLRSISHYHYRLSTRRFLLDLFEVQFTEEDMARVDEVQGLFGEYHSSDTSTKLSTIVEGTSQMSLSNRKQSSITTSTQAATQSVGGQLSGATTSGGGTNKMTDQGTYLQQGMPAGMLPSRVTRGFQMQR